MEMSIFAINDQQQQHQTPACCDDDSTANHRNSLLVRQSAEWVRTKICFDFSFSSWVEQNWRRIKARRTRIKNILSFSLSLSHLSISPATTTTEPHAPLWIFWMNWCERRVILITVTKQWNQQFVLFFVTSILFFSILTYLITVHD